MDIIHRSSGAVIFSVETDSMAVCLRAAIEAKANLRWANLSKADLSKADLSKANLSGANLSGANLSGANLVGAYRPSDPPDGWTPNADGRLQQSPPA